jgi:hypothetical protein
MTFGDGFSLGRKSGDPDQRRGSFGLWKERRHGVIRFLFATGKITHSRAFAK